MNKTEYFNFFKPQGCDRINDIRLSGKPQKNYLNPLIGFSGGSVRECNQYC